MISQLENNNLLEGIRDEVEKLLSSSLDVYFAIIREKYFECSISIPYIVAGSIDPISFSILKALHKHNELTINGLYQLLNANGRETKRVVSEILRVLYQSGKIYFDIETNTIKKSETILQNLTINQIFKKDKYYFLPCSKHLKLKKNIKPNHYIKNQNLSRTEEDNNFQSIDFKEYYNYENNLSDRIAECCRDQFKKSNSAIMTTLELSRNEILHRSQLINTDIRMGKPEVLTKKPKPWWNFTRCVISRYKQNPDSTKIKVYSYSRNGRIEAEFTKHMGQIQLEQPELIEEMLKKKEYWSKL